LKLFLTVYFKDVGAGLEKKTFLAEQVRKRISMRIDDEGDQYSWTTGLTSCGQETLGDSISWERDRAVDSSDKVGGMGVQER